MENLEYKYIVYKTTNLVNGKIYIGVHKTLTPYEFDGYLGNGIYFKRGVNKRFHVPFANAVRKYGFENFKRETLFIFDTLEEAYKKEEEIVTFDFVQRDDNYNVETGGCGGINIRNEKIIYQYNLFGEYIREFRSMSEAERILKIRTGNIHNAIRTKTSIAGYYWSHSKLHELDLSKMNTKRKIVYQYAANGEYECKYSSAKEASKALNCGSISNSMKKGELIKNKFLSFEKFDKFIPKEKYKILVNKVYQYDLEGNFLAEYENKRSVSKKYHKSIPEKMKKSHIYFGYQWSYEKVDKMPNVKQGYINPKKQKVYQYSIDGELIKTFDSIQDCKKEFPSIQRALYGAHKPVRGFIFKTDKDVDENI